MILLDEQKEKNLKHKQTKNFLYSDIKLKKRLLHKNTSKTNLSKKTLIKNQGKTDFTRKVLFVA